MKTYSINKLYKYKRRQRSNQFQKNTYLTFTCLFLIDQINKQIKEMKKKHQQQQQQQSGDERQQVQIFIFEFKKKKNWWESRSLEIHQIM